ncbi:MAG: hypothetical protein JNN07_20195 [Verrucomicrobiales bacterium]|nr:hypothetical protein [Verrucomicrobiales bacterium]
MNQNRHAVAIPTLMKPSVSLLPQLVPLLASAVFGCFSPSPARSEVPEPDNVFYGVITLGVTPVTAANTNVVVEARKSPNGPAVSSYRMGDNPAYGDRYALEVPLEAFLPLTDGQASRVGGLIYISVRDHSGVRDTRSISISQRGQLVRLDFTERDTDSDGMPDRWEEVYFGSATEIDSNEDPDGDGRNNLQEYLAGTHPRIPDGRHPADAAPADNSLSSDEADVYANAWLNGDAWPLAPTNIPIAYVTRGMALALNGGTYVYSNAPATNAPLSWVSLPAVPSSARDHFITASLPSSAAAQTPFTVTITVRPDVATASYAVEDQIPNGSEVLNISHGGALDPANRKVKWGPFPDSGERVLTYDLTAGSNAGNFTLVGTGSFDGFNVVISGNRTVGAGLPLRWAASVVDAQGLRFTLTAQASRSFVIEVSTNLVTWQVLQTVATDPSGLYQFRPGASASPAHRFYRARVP